MLGACGSVAACACKLHFRHGMSGGAGYPIGGVAVSFGETLCKGHVCVFACKWHNFSRLDWSDDRQGIKQKTLSPPSQAKPQEVQSHDRHRLYAPCNVPNRSPLRGGLQTRFVVCGFSTAALNGSGQRSCKLVRVWRILLLQPCQFLSIVAFHNARVCCTCPHGGSGASARLNSWFQTGTGNPNPKPSTLNPKRNNISG